MNAKEALKTYYGYDSFKPGQEEIIDAILSGKDVLAIMPTGAGKSVCYQVPALLLPGIAIVISPLISLMQDQVTALNDMGIGASCINSFMTDSQIAQVYSEAREGRFKLLYIAPERLESYDFIGFVRNVMISTVTVDEAHCISQWGQDFRPSYLRIIDFICSLPERPVVGAFTATATQEVREDISCMLRLHDPKTIVTGFDRENLYFDVESIKDKNGYVLEYVRKHQDDSGIIYCATRKNVDAVHELLVSAGVSATKYHAGMSAESRKRNQDDFIFDRSSVIVATNAFGMGIDKSNVRFVMHYNMPQSMENYYQEAGRAGRDGEPANCILLFSPQDVATDKFLLERKDFSGIPYEDIDLIRQRDARRLQVMEEYCRTSGCFRNRILEYFGEKRNAQCGNCGNCRREFIEIDMTEDAKKFVNCVWEAKGRYGLNIILGILLGANRARLKELGATGYKTYGALRHRRESELRLLASQMISAGYLYRTADEYSVMRIGDIEPLKNPDAHVLIRMPKEAKPAVASHLKKADRRKTDALTKAGYELFDILRKLRFEIARDEGIPPYIVFSDRTLVDMTVKMPCDREMMLDVSGVGETKLEKYGSRFIEAIRAYADGNPDSIMSVSDDSSDGSAGGGNPNHGVLKPEQREKPSSAGTAWTEEEDFRLDEEFGSGMKVSEISKSHNRTCGAIRARLKKRGLIE